MATRSRTLSTLIVFASTVALLSSFAASASAQAQPYPECPPGATPLQLKDCALKPNLSVPIPTVQFSKIFITQNGEKRTIDVPYLANYIAGVYQYAVGIASILAAVMMMVGGFQYLTAGGDAGKVSEGKEKITNALMGLFLSLGSYVILFTVNPDIVGLKGLQIVTVKQEPYLPPDESEPETTNAIAQPATNFAVPQGNNINGNGITKVPVDLAPDITRAASLLQAQGFGMMISSSFRTVDDQIRLINLNCQNPPGSATCNPKPGRPVTCMLINNDPANCPHTTGRALDIWGTKDGSACISQKDCLADKTACRQNPCQAAVLTAMRQQGFCNLSSEPWHFEKPKMSSSCN